MFARPLLSHGIKPEKNKLSVTVVFVGQVVTDSSSIIRLQQPAQVFRTHRKLLLRASAHGFKATAEALNTHANEAAIVVRMRRALQPLHNSPRLDKAAVL